MFCVGRTLGEPPFNFDINWRFPEKYKGLIVGAVNGTEIREPKDVKLLESRLDARLSREGFLWDKRNREECMLWRPDFQSCVDFYHPKEKIGIEVEKTEVKRIPHDFLKLVNGSLTFVPKIRYGVIIHPFIYRRTSGKSSKFADYVVAQVNFYFKRLIENTNLKDVLFVMYDFRGRAAIEQAFRTLKVDRPMDVPLDDLL